MVGVVGRKRGFDRDVVLDQVTRAFWRDGYQATSVADLTEATGVNPPSLYAAFGDKRALFTEAVARYQATYGAFTSRALDEESTARQAVERVLVEAAIEYTTPGRPRGCLVLSAPELHDLRDQALRALEAKIRHDVATGVLPAGTDAHRLAVFVAATARGMSSLARDGATRAELHDVARTALSAWPAPVP
ncbi:TetR/AcrR family transcriptional regulator [Actinosynnema sp. NPDC023658]|uniref:TetR/AcrR family transcriptional regulator n=1 Tax=Actinosynnema sp. NPDC023658 TaxID=3155465 RepID=UPI0033F049FC